MSHSRCALTIVLIFLFHTALPAQQPPTIWSHPVAVDKNNPELRAILTEIEADAEKAQDGSMILKWRNHVFKRQP